ncbi:MAG: glycosyltransferase family 2 protein [Syntrophomonas sp.]
MDAHAYCPPNYIKTMIEWLEKSHADNVGPTIDIKPGNESISARAIAMGVQSPFGIGSVWYRLGVAEPGWVNTVPFGAFRREVFDKIGLFSEDLYWSEDYEFNLRIKQHGGKILLVPYAPVTYCARTNLKQLALQYLRYGFGKSNVMMRNKSLKSWWQLVPPLFLLFLLLGAILRHFNWWVDVLILFVLLAYVSLSILFSLRSVTAKKDVAIILLPVVFAIIHFSFGAGFWLRIFGVRIK